MVAEAIGLLGRMRRALRLFGTRRREVDRVDRVLARKVASLTGATLLRCTNSPSPQVLKIGSRIPLISLQAALTPPSSHFRLYLSLVRVEGP